jgi:hypothetical protein
MDIFHNLGGKRNSSRKRQNEAINSQYSQSASNYSDVQHTPAAIASSFSNGDLGYAPTAPTGYLDTWEQGALYEQMEYTVDNLMQLLKHICL